MIIVDVETTGLDPSKNSIVSIGALDFSKPKSQFYQECRIFDGAEGSQKALEINGFSEEEIKNSNKKTLESAILEFIKWAEDIDDKTLAGENSSFDRDFLKASMERYGLRWEFGYRTVDLHSLGFAHYIKRGRIPPIKDRRTAISLDKILGYVGMPEEPKPHNALTGAKMEAEAFSRLLQKKILLKEFEKYPIPEHLED